jgi:hypothetical protein
MSFKEFLQESGNAKQAWWNLFQHNKAGEAGGVGNKIYAWIQSGDNELEVSGKDAESIYTFLQGAKIDGSNKSYFTSILNDIAKHRKFRIRK